MALQILNKDFGMISFRKYSILDLKNGAMAHDFSQSQIIPLSPLRLASYCHNPAARDDDFVLFTAVDGDECIAFRAVMPDYLNGKNGRIRVAWFSGNWVRDDVRRKGISTQLFYKIKEEWGDYLIFTNYAPASHQLYLKSNLFKSFYLRKGIRIYLKPPFVVIAKNKELSDPLKTLASIADKLFLLPFKLLYSKQFKQLPSVITSNLTDSKIPEYLSKNLKNSLSSRTVQEFQWIFRYGWLEKGEKELIYPFSWRFRDYEEKAYFIKNEDNTDLNGMMIVRIKNSLATIPFYFSKNSKASSELFEQLISDCLRHNIIYLTIYNPYLSAVAQEYTFFKKPVVQHYYTTDVIIDQLSTCSEIAFQDGDGEAAFV
jgi:hypothetical protein